eukprot:gnl/TRDRNA2_/TRDRNA2_42842_c0_seq1.p1 gnl/TRDRNA2_/TRDRNA2_42842_c0~~gnl/TRDRNA2_/TRDRNA2_42842_c0_seq1.p1  ORF type:complete len:469 (-),score=152.08 gnl/TRDRNA2_/TRDRNA2_42842_c0_seq1:57-1463(-)
MEAAEVEAPSKRDVESALSSLQETELRVMLERLTRNMQELEDMYSGLQVEQKELQNENTNLQDTIEKMMQETQKLNIDSSNVNAQAEDPLNVINRLWDRMKPRDTAYTVNEHMGEIKLQREDSEVSSLADVASGLRKSITTGAEQLQQQIDSTAEQLQQLQLREQLQQQLDQSTEKVQQLREQHLAPAVEVLEQRLSTGREQLQQHLAPAAEQFQQLREQHFAPAAEQVQQHLEVGREQVQQLREQHLAPAAKKIQSTFSDFWSHGESWWNEQVASSSNGAVRENFNLWQASFLEAATHVPKKKKGQRGAKSEKEERPASEEEGASALRTLRPMFSTSESSSEQQAPAGSSSSSSGAQDPPPPVPTTAEEVGLGKEEVQEQISSTLLIEATLKLDDGSVQTLQVRAADRCKQVAARFVQENSLKSSFEEPLTAWLKKVEDETDDFPAYLEADLQQICAEQSKRSRGSS